MWLLWSQDVLLTLIFIFFSTDCVVQVGPTKVSSCLWAWSLTENTKSTRLVLVSLCLILCLMSMRNRGFLHPAGDRVWKGLHATWTFELVAGLFPGIRIVFFPSFSFILFVVILSFSNLNSGVLNALIDAKHCRKKQSRVLLLKSKKWFWSSSTL